MTPATPPSSRHKRVNQSESLLKTPQRKAEDDGMGLVTPGTIRIKDRLVAPTRPTMLYSPSKTLKSPEHTPLNFISKRGMDLEKESLRPISRVLFSSEMERDDSDDERVVLLPPKRTTGFRSNEEDEFFSPKKHAKQVPGTPSDRVVTFELASKWYNESGNIVSSDDCEINDEGEQEELIKKRVMNNPFLSTEVADKETRELRKKKMLEKEPDITDTITYVDKSGKVVSKRYISQEEQELFKPVRLFSDELDKEMKKDLE